MDGLVTLQRVLLSRNPAARSALPSPGLSRIQHRAAPLQFIWVRILLLNLNYAGTNRCIKPRLQCAIVYAKFT